MQGQDTSIRFFESARASGRMHHGWLICGEAGLGTREFAYRAARALVDNMALDAVDAALLDEPHPDIHILKRGPKDNAEREKMLDGKAYEIKRNISVDQVRALQGRLTTRPTLSDRRAIIIDLIDEMETGAANALLKSLEEPPAQTVFLLIAHNPAMLLPTIRSRCIQLRFAPLEDAALTDWLRDQCPDLEGADIARCVLAAGGAPGQAYELATSGAVPLLRQIDSLIEQGDVSLAGRNALADMLTGKENRDKMQLALDYAMRKSAALARTARGPALERALDIQARFRTLAGEFVVANFDSRLLALEIGGLLARLAPPR